MGFRSNGSNGVFVWKPRKLDGNVWENCGKWSKCRVVEVYWFGVDGIGSLVSMYI